MMEQLLMDIPEMWNLVLIAITKLITTMWEAIKPLITQLRKPAPALIVLAIILMVITETQAIKDM